MPHITHTHTHTHTIIQPGMLEKQCSKFADRMRHASSFELVQKIKSFINEFVGVQSSDSAEQSSQMVRSFVEVCRRGLRNANSFEMRRGASEGP